MSMLEIDETEKEGNLGNFRKVNKVCWKKLIEKNWKFSGSKFQYAGRS